MNGEEEPALPMKIAPAHLVSVVYIAVVQAIA